MSVQDALDYCLANPDGLSVEGLLAKFPAFSAELQPLLTLGITIQRATPPPVPADRRSAMQARLLDAATHQQAARALPTAQASAAPRRAFSLNLSWLMRPTWAVVAVALLLFGGVWTASANSLPDSPFYGVRLAGERLVLAMPGSASDKVQRHVSLADIRLADIQAMQEQDKLNLAGPAFSNYYEQLNSGMTIWQGTQDGEHTALAQIIYPLCVRSQRIFATLQSSFGGLAQIEQATISQAQNSYIALLTSTERTLREGGIDLQTLLPDVTPVGTVLLGTAEPSVIGTPGQPGLATPIAPSQTVSPVSDDGTTPPHTSLPIAATGTAGPPAFGTQPPETATAFGAVGTASVVPQQTEIGTPSVHGATPMVTDTAPATGPPTSPVTTILPATATSRVTSGTVATTTEAPPTVSGTVQGVIPTNAVPSRVSTRTSTD
ncbi:MAG: DUF5667 domain-containing protein, partial [Chloroflexota bacterium]|nr:DUF5667 domain-containing protein [Chloroflexota bacterium]